MVYVTDKRTEKYLRISLNALLNIVEHPANIRTRLPVRTTGGIGANPLFAAALLDRARALSRNSAKETIILVAHGAESDQQNEQWLRTLETLAAYMNKAGSNEFRAIKVATWREDWPDKREPWIKEIRAMAERWLFLHKSQAKGPRKCI